MPTARPRTSRRLVLSVAGATLALLAGGAAVAWPAGASVSVPSGWSLAWSADFTGSAGTQPSTANVAMGGSFPNGVAGYGTPTSSTVSGRPMLVDYAAVYTKGGGGSTATPTPTGTGGGTGGTGGRDAYGTIQAESYNAQSGTQLETTTDAGGGQDVAYIADGDWLRFDGVNFGSTPARQFSGRVASGIGGGASGLVEVRLDSLTSTPVGSFALADTDGWQTWKTVPTNISAVTGTHTVYLTFTSGQPNDFVNVNWLTFGH